MSGRQDQGVRQIHPKSRDLIGDEACLEMLALARDLRSGAVPPEQYDQSYLGFRVCGTPCCILGHLRRRVSEAANRRLKNAWAIQLTQGLVELFAADHPSNSQLAADAIDRFVFDGSDNPWKV